jgi:hypothetical protein
MEAIVGLIVGRKEVIGSVNNKFSDYCPPFYHLRYIVSPPREPLLCIT